MTSGGASDPAVTERATFVHLEPPTRFHELMEELRHLRHGQGLSQAKVSTRAEVLMGLAVTQREMELRGLEPAVAAYEVLLCAARSSTFLPLSKWRDIVSITLNVPGSVPTNQGTFDSLEQRKQLVRQLLHYGKNKVEDEMRDAYQELASSLIRARSSPCEVESAPPPRLTHRVVLESSNQELLVTLQRLAELSGEVETRRLDQSELLCMLPLAVAATFPEGDFYRANAYQISWALTELVKRALAFDKVYVERARPTKGLPDDAIRMLLSRGDVFRMAHAGHLGRVPHWLVGHKHNRAPRGGYWVCAPRHIVRVNIVIEADGRHGHMRFG